MPVVLLIKAAQPGLFDKLVHVGGSVAKDGTVRAPHMAIRHVKPPTSPKPKPVSHTLDLFDDAPAPAPKAKAPAPAKPAVEAKPAPDVPQAEPAVAAVAVQAETMPALQVTPPKVDYSQPFNSAAIPAFGVPAGTSKDVRRQLNARAAAMVGDRVGLLDAPRAEPDPAVLRQYSGQGGVGDSLNEFYTDPAVAAAMWAALHDMGAVREGSTVLEPSAATGVFLEVAPAGVKVTGVELDPTSAKIGAMLHPAHEVKQSSLEAFATQDGRQFDAVVGNAPFGLRGALLKDDKPDLKTAEGYFLDTALDKTRPGGVVAMIVPTGVMDSKRDRKLRERLLRKGEFLGALRMPNTAFEHSHTGVTTDVVFFRKRPEDVAGALMAIDQKALRALGVWDDEYLAGTYFAERGAGNVLGTMTEGWRAKAGMGSDITVEGSMQGVPEAIAAFAPEEPTTPAPVTVEAILAAVPDEATRERVRAGAVKRPYDTSKRGDVKVVDGVRYVLEGEPLRWHRVDEFMATKAVSDAIDLSEDIQRAIAGEDVPDLEARVRAYIEAHGVPSKNPNLMLAAGQDKVLYRLIGAVKPDGSLSDVVTGRQATQLESSFDAAAESLALENQWFSPEMVAARWHNGDSETVLDHLYASPDYALDPVSGLWTTTDQYVSGEMWPKFDEITAALAGEDVKPEDRAKFERQLALLDEAIDPRSLEDVEVSINSAFLPLEVVTAFFNKEGAGPHSSSGPLTLTFDKGIYAANGGAWGVSGLLERYLNRSGVRKDDEMPTIDAWNADFKEWLTGSKYRDQIEELYNRKFRGFRAREYSTDPFEIPGLNLEGLKPHVFSGIRWALETGKGIVADDVGLGKTVQGLILARMAKVSGRAKKPLLIVPKSVLANWVSEAEKWFPGSSVLVIGETYTRGKDGKLKGKQDSAAERNRKYHDLSQNDYDFVLISQPAWNDLDLDPITKGKYVEDDFWVQRGDALGNAGDKRTNKIREAYNQALAGREFKSRSDAIYFNDLGVDMIIGDEMHAFKNLYAARNRFGQQPKFLGGQGLSNRALDMSLKARYIRESNDGLNVYGLTATPTKNSPLEIYSMLSHIAPEAFENIGIRNSEEFLDRFCEFKTENVLTTSGNIEEALVTVGFKNLDELRGIMRRYINRRTADSVGLKIPAADERRHLVDMSAEQEAVYADLRVMAEQAKQKDSTGDAHIFSIMDKMGKAAMDLELLDPETYKGAKSPKYAAVADSIIEGMKDGGQVVFADNIGVHPKLVEELVARGVPRERIAIMNAQTAATSAARQNIADAFNEGRLDAVIGNTATMGEGQNLQKGARDTHHMDLPWNPSSLQQRNGRARRQGNEAESVRQHTYLAKGSFDGYRYQTMMAKRDWMDLLWNGGDRVENLAREGNVSRDDLLIMLAADPDAAREQMDKNKTAAQARFDAQHFGAAADQFEKLRAMSRSFAKLKPKDREAPAGQRLRVRIDRARNALRSDAYFKAKDALDVPDEVLIQPQTGHPFRPGVAFEVDKAAGAVQGGGKFVVVGVRRDPSLGPLVQLRRYGEANGAKMAVELDKLGADVKPFDYDAKAEEAATAAHFSEMAAAKVGGMKGLKDLHGVPSSVLEANYAAIQKQAKAGMANHAFDVGYGEVGLIGPDGRPKVSSSYDARSALGDHDLMLPTDAHRKLAIEGYIADEQRKGMTTDYRSSGGRGRASQAVRVMRWPGRFGQDGNTNRWSTIGKHVFGDGFETEAHAAFERQQLHQAVNARTLQETVSHLAPTVKASYGSIGTMPKKALAMMWSRARREGKLDDQMSAHMPVGMGELMSSPPAYSGDSRTPVGTRTVRQVLTALAKPHPDLASAMVVSGDNPTLAAREVLSLDVGDHTGPAMRHLVGREPSLADRPLSDFAPGIKPAQSGQGYYQPAHPLYSRFGDRAKGMTVRELVDELTAGDVTEGEDDRRAA